MAVGFPVRGKRFFCRLVNSYRCFGDPIAFRATVPVYHPTRRNNPNDTNLQHHRCANPKPRSRLYLPQNSQTCCRSLPTSYSARTEGSVPELKRPERESDQSISSNAKVNNVWSHTSTPAICLHSVHRETLYI